VWGLWGGLGIARYLFVGVQTNSQTNSTNKFHTILKRYIYGFVCGSRADKLSFRGVLPHATHKQNHKYAFPVWYGICLWNLFVNLFVAPQTNSKNKPQASPKPPKKLKTHTGEPRPLRVGLARPAWAGQGWPPRLPSHAPCQANSLRSTQKGTTQAQRSSLEPKQRELFPAYCGSSFEALRRPWFPGCLGSSFRTPNIPPTFQNPFRTPFAPPRYALVSRLLWKFLSDSQHPP
jgi:hypothetical protein